MAYGDYDGPDKPNKGQEGGACNRTLCQAEPASWYNHGSYAWYCYDCRHDIQFDDVNLRHWEAKWRPDCGHDQFETRAMIDAREGKAVTVANYPAVVHKEPDTGYGVSFPDFPGCIAVGDTEEAATSSAADALAFHIKGMIADGETVPQPMKRATLQEIRQMKDRGEVVSIGTIRIDRQTPANRRRAKMVAQRVGRR